MAVLAVASAAPEWTYWVDAVAKAIAVITVAVGGSIAAWKYARSRTYRAGCDLLLEAETVKTDGKIGVLVRYSMTNTGTSRLYFPREVQHVSTCDTQPQKLVVTCLYARAWREACKNVSTPDWGEIHSLDILTERDSKMRVRDPNQAFAREILVPLPPGEPPLAVRVDLDCHVRKIGAFNFGQPRDRVRAKGIVRVNVELVSTSRLVAIHAPKRTWRQKLADSLAVGATNAEAG